MCQQARAENVLYSGAGRQLSFWSFSSRGDAHAHNTYILQHKPRVLIKDNRSFLLQEPGKRKQPCRLGADLQKATNAYWTHIPFAWPCACRRLAV